MENCLISFSKKLVKHNVRINENLDHPGLRFKKILKDPPVYSIRIDKAYRALGLVVDNGNKIIWFWIGSHDDYERLLSEL
ncbi:MAG: hypothetical protein WD037_14430 [Balneolales bacterium]